MSLFSEIEKTIERGFRHWTERVFGPAESGQLLLIHRAILEEIESKVQTLARGRRVFPFGSVTVTLLAPDEERRATCEAAFAAEGRLERDIRDALAGSDCKVPPGFSLEVRTSALGERPFEIHYAVEPRQKHIEPATPVQPVSQTSAAPTPEATLTVVRGKAECGEYPVGKTRVNIGRLAELTDSDHRVVRRNDVVFEEGADDANATVSRSHAHIKFDHGEYRVCDDGSEFGTRVFRDGRSLDVPKGNRRGERLKSGDEIYLGRACLRFEA
jgi:hypothetical protein